RSITNSPMWYALWSAINNASRSRFCPVPQRNGFARSAPSFVISALNFARSASIAATDRSQASGVGGTGFLGQYASGHGFSLYPPVGGAENSTMSACEMRMCSSNCQAEYGSPSGTTPRNADGKSFAASSNFACACPPSSSASSCTRSSRLSLAALSCSLAFVICRTSLHSRRYAFLLGCAGGKNRPRIDADRPDREPKTPLFQSAFIRVNPRSSLLFFRVGSGRRYTTLAPHLQIAADERLQRAIEHLVHIADFNARAQVFRHAIGLQHIAPDLRSPPDVQLRVFNLLRGRALLLQFVFIQFRAHHLHRAVLVLVLRALVLATSHQPRRNVRDAHRRVSRVHMLAAFAAAPVGIDAQVFRLDLDVDRVVDLRAYKHAGKAGMPSFRGVERRDAHQPMHARLARQQPERILAC